jgi:glycosyltransferase involved in cell wall biosynthesis
MYELDDNFNPAASDITVSFDRASSPGALPSSGAERRSSSDDVLNRVHETLLQLQSLSDMIDAELADDYAVPPLDYELPPGFRLSIVIPVYNEEATVEQVLARLAALPITKEIIVVDDCSTDNTREILKRYEHAAEMHVVFKPLNEGKGAALRTGFRRATGDVVVVQDADLEYDPRDILNLVHPLIAGQANVVYGSRFISDAPPESSLVHRLGNALLTRLSNWTTGLELTDMETCYKAFRREVISSFEIKQPRFGFEPEVTARIARRGYRVYEVPVRYRPRGYSEGKKIGLRDLFSTLYCILRYALAD